MVLHRIQYSHVHTSTSGCTFDRKGAYHKFGDTFWCIECVGNYSCMAEHKVCKSLHKFRDIWSENTWPGTAWDKESKTGIACRHRGGRRSAVSCTSPRNPRGTLSHNTPSKSSCRNGHIPISNYISRGIQHVQSAFRLIVHIPLFMYVHIAAEFYPPSQNNYSPILYSVLV